MPDVTTRYSETGVPLETQSKWLMMLGPLFRHLLTFFGGWLAAKGIINDTQAADFTNAMSDILPGVTLYLVGLLWSWAQKIKVQRNHEAEKDLLVEEIEVKDRRIERLQSSENQAGSINPGVTARTDFGSSHR